MAKPTPEVDIFVRTGKITSQLLVEHAIDKAAVEHARRTGEDIKGRLPFDVFDSLEAFRKSIDLLLIELRTKHWMGGLCHQIKNMGSLSGYGKDFQVLITSTAGRALITVRGDTRFKKPEEADDVPFVTLVAANGIITSTINFQGIYATQEEAIALAHSLVHSMPELAPDSEVEIG